MASDPVVSTFGTARPGWLAGLGHVRNVVRQELISRQLARHLPPPPARVLDVGAGQGTQSLRLAAAGHQVVAAEPEAGMRAAMQEALAAADRAVRARVSVRAGAVGALDEVARGESFDVVLALGVLMYLPSGPDVVTDLAARVAPGGLLALAVRTTVSAVWRPAARGDWFAAAAAFAELDAARSEGRDLRYRNEIGASARADDIDTLVAAAAGEGLELEEWYGVRIAVDLAEQDPPPPDDPAELAALLDVEERLGATDPYRQLGQLAHLVLRRRA